MILIAFLLCAAVAMTTVTIVTGGSDVYADLQKIHGLMRTADERLVQLSNRSCQSGYGYAEFCPYAGSTIVDTVSCVANSILSGPFVQEVEIYFDAPFLTKPSVGVFVSGISWVFGTSYNVTTVRVTPTTLTVQVSVQSSPSYVRFAYFACDQEVLFPKAYLDIQDQIHFYNDS